MTKAAFEEEEREIRQVSRIRYAPWQAEQESPAQSARYLFLKLTAIAATVLALVLAIIRSQ